MMENTQNPAEPTPTEAPKPDLQPSIQPSPEPAPPDMVKKKSPLGAIVLGAVVLILGSVYGIFVQQTSRSPLGNIPKAPTPTAAGATVSSRNLSAIASSSAFLQAESAVASLSAAATVLSVSDTTINPPAIELPLGLDTK